MTNELKLPLTNKRHQTPLVPSPWPKPSTQKYATQVHAFLQGLQGFVFVGSCCGKGRPFGRLMIILSPFFSHPSLSVSASLSQVQLSSSPAHPLSTQSTGTLRYALPTALRACLRTRSTAQFITARKYESTLLRTFQNITQLSCINAASTWSMLCDWKPCSRRARARSSNADTMSPCRQA